VLLIEYCHQKGWKPKKININILWPFLALIGFLTYLAINNQVTGNPFTFMDIQATHWHNTLNPLLGLTRAFDVIKYYNYPSTLTIGLAPILFAIFGLIMISISIWKRLRPSYIAYTFLSWALAVSTSWWISVPRYMMATFPMFIILALLTDKKKGATISVTIVSGALLCYFTALFVMGYIY
jgi:hypothetical protein